MSVYDNCKLSCNETEGLFFTQISTIENIVLCKKLPDIQQILSCVVEPEIISIKTINTMKGKSYEGQYLSGKKVVIELKLKQKLLYVSDKVTQTVHAIENEFFQSAYIVVPYRIEGTDPEYLIDHKYLKPVVLIEDKCFKQISKRNIFKSICLMIKLEKISTYEICYTLHNNCNTSNIFLMYKDGSNNIKLTDDKAFKNVIPKWSPYGSSFAFLSNKEGCRMIYLYCIKTYTFKRITSPSVFKSITSFCWAPDGRKICFTGFIKNSKELFVINLRNLKCTRLTFGEKIFSSCKPKYSPDGKQIAFIKYYSGIGHLWLMNDEGGEGKKITYCKNVKYFDWSPDSKNIAYISSEHENKDEIRIINIRNFENRVLIDCKKTKKKTKILYSPDNCNLVFIGECNFSENLYLYNLKNEKLKNLTKYSKKTLINNFTWDINSSNIYYSAKESFYCYIYSISIERGNKIQITTQIASESELSYRPRIF